MSFIFWTDSGLDEGVLNGRSKVVDAQSNSEDSNSVKRAPARQAPVKVFNAVAKAIAAQKKADSSSSEESDSSDDEKPPAKISNVPKTATPARTGLLVFHRSGCTHR